jgi:predicted Rossmann fold flavoprotein
MNEARYDVIIIGGGAAGMMAAGVAAERGKSVLLLERNARLGEKLRISGGGRCNITNAEPDERKLLAKYGSGEKFLHSAFSQFGMQKTFSFFESKGLPPKIEANNRAFPKTEKAADVVRVLEQYLKAGKVDVRTSARVENIESRSGRIERVIAKGKAYTADSYILATGGLSHPETGSTGDGFAWLRSLGHTVENPTPTIVPLKVKEPWVKKLAGVSAEAKLTFLVNGKKKFSKSGPMLFTHFGISGPTVLNAAGQVADGLQEGEVRVRIDLYPALDLGVLDKQIAKLFDEGKNRLLRNAFKDVAPPGSSEALLSLVPSIDPEKKVHSLRKEERRLLAELLKGLELTITGLLGFERAVVADGGLMPSEVDMRTMRSRRFDNLFVTGDVLHITRPSGGYSLQLCWTTGFVAGTNA